MWLMQFDIMCNSYREWQKSAKKLVWGRPELCSKALSNGQNLNLGRIYAKFLKAMEDKSQWIQTSTWENTSHLQYYSNYSLKYIIKEG